MEYGEAKFVFEEQAIRESQFPNSSEF